MRAMSDTERFIVAAWDRAHRFATVDALLSAARYARTIGRTDDATDMVFCAGLALESMRGEQK